MKANMIIKNKVHYGPIPVKAFLLITFLQLLSHQDHTPIWLSVFAVMVCILKYLSYRSAQASIPFWLRIVLVISSSLVFFFYYRTNFTVEMAASFLLLACILKLIEIRSHKDIIIFIYTMFYLSSVSFLFEQGILQTLLQISVITTCFYVLFIIQIDEGSLRSSHYTLLSMHSKSMLKLMGLALPIVVIIFLFFPRISPLWQMPIKSQVSKVGISTEMSPGDVSELAKSSEPAFRATFDLSVPERSSLYWKGLILDQFDGRKWTQSASSSSFSRLKKVDTGRFFETQYPSYQVMLEPHQQKWVFSLEGSQLASSNLTSAEMGLFNLKTEAIQPTRYQMELPPQRQPVRLVDIPTAFLVTEVERITSYQLQDLQLPSKRSNTRSQDYIRRLKTQYSSPEQLLVYLLNQFREDTFFYTLEPPLLGEDFVDEFIFDTKSGFCGHYAGSLTYLLRLAGIPARVVIGYQGGEYNVQSNYLLVSQYDAHAWVEAFLPNRGWIRVDPTAMVSPLRVSDGIGSSLGNERSFLQDSPFASAAMKYDALNWIRLRLDEVNFQWQNLVVNYNQDQQENLIIKVLGENSLLRIALLFAYLFIAFFFMAMFYFWYKGISGYTRAEKKYMIWLFVLSRFGYKRHKGETPRLFLQRIQMTKHKRLASITANKTRQLEEKQYRGSR